MQMQNLVIWGREISVNVIFDCYKGEEISDVQKMALNDFIANLSALEDAKAKVEQYCISENKLDGVQNIFQIVMPRSLYVKRTNDNTKVVSVLCAYRFDTEHGLAIVFKDNVFEKIGPQDIVL